MGWRDLLQAGAPSRVVVPWLGGRDIRQGERRWSLSGQVPEAHGWHAFDVEGRGARWAGPADPEPEGLTEAAVGYLVGDLFVSDGEGGEVGDLALLVGRFPRVRLVEEGIDHFARVRVAPAWADGPLVFVGEEFPLGPEDEVRGALLDERPSVDHVAGVPPALDLAFRVKRAHREWVERQRQEAQRLREEAERRRIVEAHLRRIRDHAREAFAEHGDGATRRELAQLDFGEAARAALALGGATYLEHRRARLPGEYVVRYRIEGERYECVCDERLHIIDAGICLEDHRTGEKGDTYFTLESLPGVTREAMAIGAAIWRHV
ncbi:MAG: hypothetical protein ACFCGT_05905 [Sandaracinaceae bacterium]